MVRLLCTMIMRHPIQVIFFRTETGNEPVREWLKSLSQTEKKAIGEDIKTVQFGWPLAMPLVRKLERGLWEIRTKMTDRIFRVVFTIYDDCIVLLHGFIKKSQKIPASDLHLSRKRMAQLLMRRNHEKE